MTQSDPGSDPGPIPAPELPDNTTWLQGGPIKLAGLRGKVAMVDFWDYTCVTCLHTLPYVKEWHSRYADHGLTVIGVHAPEFSFAHNSGHVRDAVAEHGLTYPIAIDNDYEIWQSWANQYWPAKYLIDAAGNVVYYHFGEGGYREMEAAIQAALKAATPDAILPGIMEPLNEMETPGAVCYRVTPELYLGYQRGRIGNTVGVAPDKPTTYRDIDKHAEGFVYLEGDWLLGAESVARPIGAMGESRLHVKYLSKEVNVVMHPPLAGGSATLEVLQDGLPLAAEDAGADVTVADGKATVTLDSPRMYRLVNNNEIDTCELTLATSDEGVALYAFTFVSCLVPEA